MMPLYGWRLFNALRLAQPCLPLDPFEKARAAGLWPQSLIIHIRLVCRYCRFPASLVFPFHALHKSPAPQKTVLLH